MCILKEYMVTSPCVRHLFTEGTTYISVFLSGGPLFYWRLLFKERICSLRFGGGVVRWCWVSFQCWGIILIWSKVGQGPNVLAVGAGGDLFGHFFSRLLFLFSFFLWETARYRLKYCLKGLLSPKQPTNQSLRFLLE